MVGGAQDFIYNPSNIDSRKEAYHKEQEAADGLLPTYFGGKIGWQQINKMAIDSYLRGGIARNIPGADKLYPLALAMDQNPIVVQKAIDHARGAYNTAKAFNTEQTDFGQRLGAMPGQGFASSIGPFRPPFINPSARVGTMATIDATISGALKPGIGRDDIKNIKAELADVGYYPGSGDAERLENGLTELHQIDPRLANTDMAYQMTRYGSNSMEEFVRVMRKVEPAAKAASIGIEDTINAMQVAADNAQNAGGNPLYGAEAVASFQNRSGLQGEVFNDLTQNPIIQGRTFSMTGLPDFAQGAIPPAAKEMITMSAFSDTVESMGNYGPQQFTLPSGETFTIPARDVKAAMLKQAFPELSTREIKELTKPNRMKNYMNSLKADVRADEVVNLANSNKPGSLDKAMKRSNTLVKLMKGSRDAMGKAIYSPEDIDKVQNAGGDVNDIGFGKDGVNIDAITELGSLDNSGEALYDFLKNEGFEHDSGFLDTGIGGEGEDDFVKRVLNENPNLKKEFLVRQRAAAVKKIDDSVERRNKGQDKTTNRNAVTIDFTPQAKKWLRKVEPGAMAKEAANAGKGPINAMFPVAGALIGAVDDLFGG
jgi:hypothetical protein